MDVVLPYRWTPRDYQRPLWEYLKGGGTRAVACWHRRSGKDEVGLHHVACAAHQRVGNYWYMLPQYGQARKSMWDAVNPHTGQRRIDEAFPRALRRTTRDQEMLIPFKNGSTFQLVGSDNFNSLVGSPPVGLVFSEYALSSPSAWGYLRPILLENGGWAIFNSTPRGRNHFHALLRLGMQEAGWFAETLTAAQTGCFSTDQLQSELREIQSEQGVDYGYALWLQEYFCSFDAAIPGSIWGDCVKAAEDEGRVTAFALDPALPVQTAWDLGRTDDTAIWWYQVTPTRIDVVDHHSSSLKDMPFYLALLEEKRREHGITYGLHTLPHDARPRTLAAGGKSILQQCVDAAHGNPALGRFVIGKRLDVQEGIQAARKTFPHCRFHALRCAKGLDSLRQYHREWDTEKKIFHDTPEHDWCLAGETEVLTRYGTCRIMDLPSTGEVLTSCGWKLYINPRITRSNAPLVAVEFVGGYTVKCTPDHYFLTEHGWRFAQSLRKGSQIQSSLIRSRSISMAVSIAYGRAKSICHEVARNCIELFGKGPLGAFQMEPISITAIMMRQIIDSPISKCFPPRTTYQAFIHDVIPYGRVHTLAMKRVSERLSGIAPKSADYGTAAMPSAVRDGPSGSALIKCARHARRILMDWTEKAGIRKFIAVRNAKWLQVEHVAALNERADVWCLTVPGVHDFSLANGAIVHNSSHDADAFRYLSLSWRRRDAAQPDSPLETTLLAQNPGAQTFGQLKQRYLAQRRRERAWRVSA